MLILSREAGQSIMVVSGDHTCLISVLKLLHRRKAAALLISRVSLAAPEALHTRSVEAAVDAIINIDNDARVTLIDVRGDRVRIGVDAPEKCSVHRLEVYAAIKAEKDEAKRVENRRHNRDDDLNDGMEGAPVPRPSSPKPPTLDVRLKEPPGKEEGGR